MKIIFGFGFIALLFFSCHKGAEPPMQTVRLDSAFSYYIDSCCINIPNVFTPNNDGINDYLYCHAMYVADFHLQIYNSSDHLVFLSSMLSQPWDGKQNTSHGPVVIKGRYRYNMQALSLSGRLITATGYITVIQDTHTDCITHVPAALCGDMLDPRYCVPVYQTLETFCYAD